MSRYMLSRRDGYDLRLSMMEDRLRALPEVLFQKILGILGANEAAVRIQRYFRGVDTRIRIPAGGSFGSLTGMAPRPTRRTQVAWTQYGGRYRMLRRRLPWEAALRALPDYTSFDFRGYN